MNKPELNIFVEDAAESGLDLGKITEKLKKMTRYFLAKENFVKKSCLNGYEYDTLCFDIVFCTNDEIHRINKEYRNIDRPTDVISFAIFADSAPKERFIFDNEIHKSELAEGLSMNVLYYGNLPGEYSVMLSADFLPEESDSSVCFIVPETAEEAVDLNLDDSSSVRVSINEIGPQEGLEIMDMQVSTDDALHSNLRLDFKVV